ncbi:HAMP domain-containing histidine kinase [Shewanella sp. C32]|uniref:HAMP domain-containing histidine kinase n=1 Tax=Shewanella electrica TaxID=515560 RepID=A0ABT2FNV5_9GAMM|nr:HAMP domain-containing sensor histidine kinase [Shewanella electrica]MCH1926711.1 HAMP domain-containing histidine kinase [Shewanella electrica]MCS4558028.1 HAMP domain-containing histidine kinase [Shewanella electrica]
MHKKFDGRTKVRILTVVHLVGIILFAAVSALLMYNVQFNAKYRDVVTKQSDVLHRAGRMAVQELAELENFIRLLSINGVVRQSILAEQPLMLPQLQQEFVVFGRHIQNLLQIRWIDNSGNEKVRVDVEAGRAFGVLSEELQYKGDRYYFVEGMAVASPHVYLSPLDLNVEHGRIVIPYEPTVRITLRTEPSEGLRSGLLVINYNLGPFLQRISQLAAADISIELTNNDGYWFVHRDPDNCWGRDLNHPELTLANAEPALWQQIQQSDYFIGQMINNRLVSFQRESISDTGFVIPDRKINILVSTPEAIIVAMKQNAMLPALLLGGVVLLIGILFIVRDYFSRMAIERLSTTLALERDSLAEANEQLDTHLRQMSLLQDDLAESKRLSSLGIMVAGVSHEMNTPLGGALLSISEVNRQFGLLQHALQRGLTKSALDEFMDKTKAALTLTDLNLRQANSIIKSFKRMTVDRINDEFTDTQLAQLVDDLLQALQSTFKNANVTVNSSIPPEVRLITQPGILSQVLQNLLLNAVDHAFDGAKQGHIFISCEEQAAHLVIVVADDGCGIAPAMLDKIFDPFVTKQRGKKHTGLGLHLVHQWVNHCLYGSICARSLKLGSSFEIKLLKNPLPRVDTQHRSE